MEMAMELDRMGTLILMVNDIHQVHKGRTRTRHQLRGRTLPFLPIMISLRLMLDRRVERGRRYRGISMAWSIKLEE